MTNSIDELKDKELTPENADQNNQRFLDDLREKYIKVRKLLGPPPKSVPPSSSATEAESSLQKSKNEAVEILKEMKIKIADALNNDAANRENEKLTAMLAVVWLDIGVVAIDSEDLMEGEQNLMRCIETLAGREVSAEGILAAISALNQLGIVWFQLTEPRKAEAFLKDAERHYKTFTARQTASETKLSPVGMASLFGIVDENEPSPDQVLDKLYTLTLYYLAQIYGLDMNHHKSAEYCHMTLRRQLNHDDLDHIDWALNAATLSQFFMEKNAFNLARHHLAAATYILGKYKDTLGPEPAATASESEAAHADDDEKSDDNSSEIVAAAWERFRHRSADVARCWAKYGIMLMSTSRDRLIRLSENAENSESEKSNKDEEDLDEDSVFENMKFTTIEKDVELIANSQITDNYLLDFNDARAVFLNVQQWLDESKKYYNFESHASDYVEIIQDMSQAFKHLSFFEDNEERQAKMHKRRIDILEPVANELNPRYYQTECRQMWVELAGTYSAILNIKLDKLRASDERPSPQALTKINNLAQSAIQYYLKFLDSLKESPDSPPVTKFSDDMLQPALIAYFHLGTLYNKIITPDKPTQLENVKKSIAAYKFFVDYCESSEELSELMKAELNVCKDLVNLLPLKMNKLLQTMSIQS